VDKEKLFIEVKSDKSLTSKEYAEIVALTSQAFKRDYTPFMEMFPDPTHVLGRLSGQLVSYVLWITRWLQIDDGPLLRAAYIEGMATELSHRHKGFASQLVRRAETEIQDYDIAALSTGSHSFYERLGWKTWDGPLYTRKEKELIAMPEEQGCAMVLALPKSPPLDITAPLSIEWRELEPW
jgi:aminoglycoside 2'-N-acetyltransferase I